MTRTVLASRILVLTPRGRRGTGTGTKNVYTIDGGDYGGRDDGGGGGGGDVVVLVIA